MNAFWFVLDRNQARVKTTLTRLSLLGQGAARKSLQIRAGLQKVCTKLTPAAVGLSA